MASGYRGDVTVGECWSALSEDPSAVLVDVRTAAEWTYVGIPDLSRLRQNPLLIEWQSFPSMEVDPDFAARVVVAVKERGGDQTTPIYFLCRSGVRSIASAKAATSAGFENCFNVIDGFEGPPDEDGHRGRKAGWKAEDLPWLQR
ncbi:rhodanese-like domain-containing protein [Jiella marina]|uniref:rhodanese-like domain-containing protein n=1 Tax=Jiella sp. LLJ827 TaxID=2917712 RepID=UPI002100D0B7|nr:rhodanese-like domain-containing protein [Jiella sp. LLJ827]MCQ0989436.1 rhodanese-like domain-containing protein [Jiella sp. LLJ827]